MLSNVFGKKENNPPKERQHSSFRNSCCGKKKNKKTKKERTEKDSFVIERECESQNPCQHRRREAENAWRAVTRLVADTQRTPNMPFQEDELYVFPSEVQKIGLPRRGTVTLTL